MKVNNKQGENRNFKNKASFDFTSPHVGGAKYAITKNSTLRYTSKCTPPPWTFTSTSHHGPTIKHLPNPYNNIPKEEQCPF